MRWEDEHIGRRVQYTGRNKNVRYGELREILTIGTTQQLDLNLDGSIPNRRFYVPSDTVKLVPDELLDATRVAE